MLATSSLAERLEQQDADDFVGREQELSLAAQMWPADSTKRLAFVHGTAGVGKTTFLRELGRHGTAAGWTPVKLTPEQILQSDRGDEAAVLRVFDVRRPLLLIDCQDAPLLIETLRTEVVHRLPCESRLVVTSRVRPDRRWFDLVWGRATVEIELGELSAPEAAHLLARLGVEDGATARRLRSLVGGSPLGLVLASQLLADGEVAHGELMRQVWRRIAPNGGGSPNPDALLVAARAPTINAELLHAAVPGVDAEATMSWLSSSGLTVADGLGLKLTPMARQALRAELERADRRDGRRPVTPSLVLVESPPDDHRDAARRALRDYHRPDLLDRNPLAVGMDPGQRVTMLRAVVDDAVAYAFGESESERNLREALRLGYIEASTTHDRAALDMHVSRTTYFRWLRMGVARVADYIGRTLEAERATS